MATLLLPSRMHAFPPPLCDLTPPALHCFALPQDHFRKYVRPVYTDIVREGDRVVGVVEFESAEDLKYAIKKLDDTEFKNPFDTVYIRIEEDTGSRGGGGGRSPPRGRSPSRSRSRSRSPVARGRSPSRSRYAS